MLAIIWAGDLGNHVLDTEKGLRGTSGTISAPGQRGCSLESKEAITPYYNKDDYGNESGDGTQMEKVK